MCRVVCVVRVCEPAGRLHHFAFVKAVQSKLSYIRHDSSKPFNSREYTRNTGTKHKTTISATKTTYVCKSKKEGSESKATRIHK